MATGVIRATKPKQMRVLIEGELPTGCSAKDIALFLISRYGAAGGKRCAVEFAGSTIERLPMEGRLTLCNMAVEFAAHSAVIAPDETTRSYLRDRSPDPSLVERVGDHWMSLNSDEDAAFDYEIRLDASEVAPLISWGTSPEECVAVNEVVPVAAATRALDYMGLAKGQTLTGLRIDGAFIGSCTNGRLSDLQAAAEILRGRRVPDHVRAVCVPGSKSVRRAAEALGIDRIFKDAGFEWGEPGCAMCFYAGGETFAPKARVVSSTNRNFEGRQGPGVRTHITSPAVVAASAVAGVICAPSALPVVAEVEV